MWGTGGGVEEVVYGACGFVLVVACGGEGCG